MTAAVLDRQDVMLLVLDAAANNQLEVGQAFLDGIDVTSMVDACETANLIYRVGAGNQVLYALHRYGAALRDELALSFTAQGD